jgi:hypothetical protein
VERHTQQHSNPESKEGMRDELVNQKLQVLSELPEWFSADFADVAVFYIRLIAGSMQLSPTDDPRL